MNILKADNSNSGLFNKKDHSNLGSIKKKAKKDEFKTILEQTMSEQSEDWEEFRVLLPKHAHFWDNGYEDLD